MNKQLSNPVINGITRSTAAYLLEKRSKNSLQQDGHHLHKSSQLSELVISRKKKISVKVDSLAQGILHHVRLAPKLTDTLKGKLSLGARILQLGGVEKVFKKLFNVVKSSEEGKDEQEKLVKASQCYVSTTNGPIAGLLFITTHRIAFCSERCIKVVSPTGKLLRIYYKVSIPMRKITRANTSHDIDRPSHKYIQVVTQDNFEFWFMGFLNHRKTLQCVQQMVMLSRSS
ncbi:OLC1v1033425C1 [Oldenlandia corymbosa var. corymbosa]|uniref:OLC1v1033425C1 n=1 Tax=Oldenlandia corymbosa var. corymbosa TaxID=529605 RepID=A0AAV1CPQ4_OLDCO|nr:OLC1v1033425C1 [Oldenlandia corymbosa var. corymbosa]